MVAKYWQLCCVCCLGLALSACQSVNARGGYYSSPLLPGDEVEILKTVTIEPELARVYIQHGRLGTYSGIDQYAPFCYFLLRDPLPVEQRIEPGRLTVASVWLDETEVSREQPVRVAGMWPAGGGRGPIAFQFHIHLTSPRATGFTLVCSGAFDAPALAEPIRLPELREALGDYAQVTVKE
ncbi:MAG: hypothetical protein ACWGNB_10025 [Thiogranum sp.]